jgi:hypothetical protein
MPDYINPLVAITVLFLPQLALAWALLKLDDLTYALSRQGRTERAIKRDATAYEAAMSAGTLTEREATEMRAALQRRIMLASAEANKRRAALL